ncbi:MAG: hypothetical protein IPM54_02705 [Polyangiaceae bacterium]|nr:hypothetical protein [Polyangiaceae bacterium]
MLDALSGAKAVYDSMIPPGWTGLGDLLDCAYIPYKVGRAFYTDRVEYHNPDMPDFTPSWMRDGK